MSKKQPSHKKRAIQLLESHGWTVADTEHRAYGRTVDLLGFCDLLAFREITLFLQVTSVSRGWASNVNARTQKILSEPLAAACKAAGNLIEVWGMRDSPSSDGGIVMARGILLIGGELRAVTGSDVLTDSEAA